MARPDLLKLRSIGQNDYRVLEGRQRIGRIRFASERTPGIWLWNVTVNIPGPPLGSASGLDDTKQRFKAAWLAFKEKHGPEKLAKAYAGMNLRDESSYTPPLPRTVRHVDSIQTPDSVAATDVKPASHRVAD